MLSSGQRLKSIVHAQAGYGSHVVACFIKCVCALCWPALGLFK